MLNLLGVVRTVICGLRKIHTIFGGFGLYSLAIEQLISRINTLFKHYHTLSNISKKLDMSLWYLQLQLGTPHNPFTLDYNKWGYLAPLSWVKMLWCPHHLFTITLHMDYPTILHPHERDQVIMEIIQTHYLTQECIQNLSRCRCKLEAIFLLDITTTNRQYLEHSAIHFTGRATKRSSHKFPQEQPTAKDWAIWG
jgi:hypothetical protein